MALVCLAGLGGCGAATQDIPGNFSVIAPKAGTGVIYVGRSYGWNETLLPVTIELDGREIAELGVKEYTRIEVSPGQHTVSPPAGYWTRVKFGEPHPAVFQVEAGKAYYLLPRKWVENVRPSIQVIGSTVVPTQTADRHGTFDVEVKPASAEPPATFRLLNFVPPAAGKTQ
jgi:hypothetical protein